MPPDRSRIPTLAWSRSRCYTKSSSPSARKSCKHKWIESEKAGYDIGFEKALLDWIVKYRAQWREQRKESREGAPPRDRVTSL